MLRAFVQGDHAMFDDALQGTLASVATQLQTHLPEGHAPFNKAIVQLQMAVAVGCAVLCFYTRGKLLRNCWMEKIVSCMAWISTLLCCCYDLPL